MATEVASNIQFDHIDPRQLDLSQSATRKDHDEFGMDCLHSGELETFFSSVDGNWNDDWDCLDSDVGLGPQYTTSYAEVPIEPTTGSATQLTTSATYDQQLVNKIVDGVSARLATMSLYGSTTTSVPQDNTISLPINTDLSHNADDSDCSWSVQDNHDHFHTDLRQDLNDLVRDFKKDNCEVYVSKPLPKKKRRFVHTLAHLRRLNHVTVRSEGDQVMLVAWAAIVDKESQEQLCWKNYNYDWKLEFDPTSISLIFPSDMPVYDIDTFVERLPLEFAVEWSQREVLTVGQTYTASFPSVARSLSTYNVLRKQASSNNEFTSVKIILGTWKRRGHTRFSREEQREQVQKLGGENVEDCTTETLRRGQILKYGLFASSTPEHREKTKSRSRSPTQLNMSSGSPRGRRQTVTLEHDGYASAGSGRSSKRSLSVYRQDLHSSAETKQRRIVIQKPGESNGSLNPAFDESDPKRRKRFPKGEYVCQEPDCGKVFEYVGDRTKHERIHSPTSEHPHGCTRCDKRFINLKDAERHSKVHLRNKKWWPNVLS